MASRTAVSAVVTFLLISAPSQVKEKRREIRLRVVQNCSEAISGIYRFRFKDRFVRPPEDYLTIQIVERALHVLITVSVAVHYTTRVRWLTNKNGEDTVKQILSAYFLYNDKEVVERINRLLYFDTTRTAQKRKKKTLGHTETQIYRQKTFE
jgi:hypothetical protein